MKGIFVFGFVALFATLAPQVQSGILDVVNVAAYLEFSDTFADLVCVSKDITIKLLTLTSYSEIKEIVESISELFSSLIAAVKRLVSRLLLISSKTKKAFNDIIDALQDIDKTIAKLSVCEDKKCVDENHAKLTEILKNLPDIIVIAFPTEYQNSMSVIGDFVMKIITPLIKVVNGKIDLAGIAS